MSELTVGKTYYVRHSRKGSFSAKLVANYPDTAVLEIVMGTAAYISCADAAPGDEISVRKSLCHFEELQGDA